MAAEYSKKLTKTDIKDRLVVPEGWLQILPPPEDWNVDSEEVTIKVFCLFGFVWEFRLAIRNGRYNKPVLQALEWQKFVGYVRLREGDKIILQKEHNPQRGTDYSIIAQRQDNNGRWADLERTKRDDPPLYDLFRINGS